MSYNRQNFYPGLTLTADHMKNIENGIIKYADAPDGNQEVFTYSMDTGYDDVMDLKQSPSTQGNFNISTDTACIMLPTTYTPDGAPTKLILMNRGAGGDYTGSMNYTINKALLAAGFATLHIRGIPLAFQNSKYIQGVYGAPYGSPIWIRSAVEAYNYVVKKYNIDKNGCGMFGASCGGLQSLNLANAQVLPIVAVAVDAPVIDLHNDCYFGGDWITGSLGGRTAAGIAWMYQFDYCDFNAGTYTIGETTYKFADRDRTSLEALWQLNKKRVEPYNAYEAGKFISRLDGDTPVYGIKFPCPVKCWFGLSETTNSVSVAQDFIERCRVGGTIAEFRGCPTSVHGVHQTGTAISFNGMSVSPYAVEEILWLSRWLGVSANNFVNAKDDDANTDIDNIMNMNTTVFLSGNDGSLIQSDTDHDYKKVSDYIEIPEGAVISEFASITHMDGINAYCVFYDENKTFISAYKPTTSDGTVTREWKYTETPPTIPSGAKYIRVAFNTGLAEYNSTLDIVKQECATLEFFTYA